MKYEVKVDYKKFLFDDRLEAMDFAEQAKLHADEDAPIVIKLIKEEEEA